MTIERNQLIEELAIFENEKIAKDRREQEKKSEYKKQLKEYEKTIIQ